MNDQSTRSRADDGDVAAKRRAAQCLLDYLKVHGKNGRAFEVLFFLARETVRRIDEGREAVFNNHAIRHGVLGDKVDDPSAWLSPLWKNITGDLRAEREEGLQAFAREQGLDVYPWVAKLESSGGAGNQALYSLVALPLPDVSERVTATEAAEAPPAITYIPAENVQPAWWAGWLFDRDRIAAGWRKGLLIWPTLLWFVVLAFLALFALIALGQDNHPLTTRNLVILVVIALMAAYCLLLVRRFEQLVDDRIIMAFEGMVGFREFGVCLELFRPSGQGTGTPSCLRMVKYAAQCPVCKSQVLLAKGEPDFPRRIVGRCQESPREHVFSFDRMTRSGSRLR